MTGDCKSCDKFFTFLYCGLCKKCFWLEVQREERDAEITRSLDDQWDNSHG